MNATNPRDPFRGLRVPAAPDDLRRRALQAAVDAMEPGHPPTIWDRIWESRALGRAWASVTIGLLVAHAALTFAPKPSESPGPTRSVDRGLGREVRKSIGLPAVEISSRAAALVLGAESRPAPTQRSDGSGTSDRS